MSSGIEEDAPALSPYAEEALRQVLFEQTAASQQDLARLPEDWALSQFWYSDETAEKLSREALTAAAGKKIALLSCPTLLGKLKQMSKDENVTLFEFDKRFAGYGSQFVFYDYCRPLEIAPEYHHSFNVVVADPPYLSEECLKKSAQTIKLLAVDNAKILLCTGYVMKDLAKRLLDVRPTDFEPQHEGGLRNEFGLLTNYKTEQFKFWDT